MANTSRHFFINVLSFGEDFDDVVIPNGVTWEFSFFSLSASPILDTEVSVIWDFESANEDILAMTHTSLVERIIKERTGDGVKKLAIFKE